jgi:quercetin dioxygenase-like cupin family protein
MTSTSDQDLSIDLRVAPSFSLSGATVRPFSGASITIAQVELPAGTQLAAHSHPHEQMTVIESGRLRFFVDGHEPFEVGPGELAHIPSNVEHGLEALEDTVSLDVFSPVREEFRQKLADAQADAG